MNGKLVTTLIIGIGMAGLTNLAIKKIKRQKEEEATQILLESEDRDNE